MGEEVMEEVELTAEEIFAQHKAEIDAAFEEKGFFRRMGDMFSGLSRPRDSAEYKLARVELQRLAAPLCAIVLPALFIVVLIVVTAISGQGENEIKVDISRPPEDVEELTEDPPEEIVDTPPPDESVEVQVDTPNVNFSDAAPSPVPPTNEPVSVKPAPADAVSIIKSPVSMKSMSGSRTPGIRGKMTGGGAMYGDKNTEAAVMMALRWLKKTQLSDGSWNERGVAKLSNASLAVLSFLAHGETPQSEEFGYTVQKAIQFIVDALNRDAKPVKFKFSDGNEYAFLIATYALSEAFGMTKNPECKDVAMLTLKRIIDNQSATGGWDYKMNKASTRDDSSYAGWAIQALKAGKLAGLHPDGLEECIKKAIHCLKSRNFTGTGFRYTAGNGQTTGLTATGCLAMQLLGYHDESEVEASLETMRPWLPAFETQKGVKINQGITGNNPQYYCYYASQCKYQAGMRAGAKPADVQSWQDWNLAMKKLYPTTIVKLDETIEGPDGKQHPIGYWKYVSDVNCKSAGNVMTTCLCALQLMVYYRYLPSTQAEKGPSAGSAADQKASEKEVSIDVDI